MCALFLTLIELPRKDFRSRFWIDLHIKILHIVNPCWSWWSEGSLCGNTLMSEEWNQQTWTVKQEIFLYTFSRANTRHSWELRILISNIANSMSSPNHSSIENPLIWWIMFHLISNDERKKKKKWSQNEMSQIGSLWFVRL